VQPPVTQFLKPLEPQQHAWNWVILPELCGVWWWHRPSIWKNVVYFRICTAFITCDNLLEKGWIISCASMSSLLIIRSWHKTCVSILGMLCWQMHCIFRSFLRMVQERTNQNSNFLCNCLSHLAVIRACNLLCLSRTAADHPPLIHYCSWACDTTQTFWTGTVFV